MNTSNLKRSTQCRLWLNEHYDAVVNRIDMFVEGLLLRQPQPQTTTVGEPELHKSHLESVEIVRRLEQTARQYLMDNLAEFDALGHLDDDELKRRLFGYNYCYVVNKINKKNSQIENLLLVVDSFREQHLIDYLQDLVNFNENTEEFKRVEFDQNYICMHKIDNLAFDKVGNNAKIQTVDTKNLFDHDIFFVCDRVYHRYDENNKTDFEESRRESYKYSAHNNRSVLLQCVKQTVLSDKSNDVFKHFENLKFLCIWNLRLEEPYTNMFRSLKHLKYLEIDALDEYSIDKLDETTFDALESLDELFVNRLGLKTLTKRTFLYLNKLKRLNFWNNRISYIEEYTFEHFYNLETLELHKNKLKVIRSHMFTGLRNLNSLQLSENKIVTIESGSLSSCTNLTYLDLEKNPIKTMPENVSLPSSIKKIKFSSYTN